MSFFSMIKKAIVTNDAQRSKSRRLTILTSGASIAAIGALSMTAPTLANAKTVQPSSANYSFTVEDKYKGTATRTLSKSGNTWKYDVNARVAGVASAVQSSTFTIIGNNVTPTQASTTYKLLGMGRTHKLNFNPRNKKVTSNYKGKTTTMDMAQQAFDDLSLEVQIRQDLLNGKFSGNYYMAKKDKIEKTPFKKSGNTKVTVPAGTFDTVRVDRIHDDNSRSTSFWLAPSLNYLPVKVSQINDGKKMDLELTKVN
ncbi:MAG: DUF3108 domain-containing protein [Psychrobacter sp.]|jgi:hypothetical protein|uniref:DUF3108 domain-containing protein n=1 Tax=Psychrobacter TaxID=497 RepID=UPI001E6359F1|nr:DUF3108 domain-containing protein [Psychrobacter sp. CCUG 69069]MCD1278937.1 DUF3108 domain-containing protein [Psychrobacter sp. CCUG 69069]MCD6251870.1 DUF3108 domain-containing protein [Psychrobacter sp.]|tara:strand:- start:1505 stop:2269 length:765 start_codon:yes stop_codon:yes gene_type:complete